ncbi:hypothetical protein JCM19301_2970 [Jejuia pallidilutea]|uniref:Uncharacterized protein n=1 Tax=Jejuia pallidilutea TaxID=504487 RepID=A0A090WP38_9FLAO|nr:hypothetical protein JCM19301_2970 [Jejuia pallidilutea]GAL91142.1 hypothetical protein JCM19538_16 [Jejuia pallidilutea]
MGSCRLAIRAIKKKLQDFRFENDAHQVYKMEETLSWI